MGSRETSTASRPIAQLPLHLRGRRIWHKSTPSRIIEAGSWNGDGEGWQIWSSYLLHRKRSIRDVLPPNVDNWLTWSDPTGSDRMLERLSARLDKITRRRRRRRWIRREIDALFTRLACWRNHPQAPLECLAWTYALPKLSAALDSAAWWDLLSSLLDAASDADALDLEHDPIPQQLLSVELRFTLAYVLPELKPCRRLAPPAIHSLANAFERLLRADGTLPASRLVHLRGLLGCWTRCCYLSRRIKQVSWSGGLATRFQALVDQSWHLLTPSGQQLFSADANDCWPASLLPSALAACRNGQGKSFTLVTDLDASERRDQVGWQSDLAAYSVLRSGWKRADHVVAVDYCRQEPRLELWVGSEPFFRGAWKLALTINGAPCPPQGDWESVCWVCDDDITYLELQAPFANDVKVQRQILLGRKRDFLYLNDVVLSPNRAEIDYSASLALAPRLRCQPAEETREIQLAGQRRKIIALPIELGEWKRDAHREGELAVRGNLLELRLRRDAQALALPLFFDLKQGKRYKPTTWRRLTVAENRRMVPRDRAVGYRVQIGSRQYVFYRSLDGQGMRTVLGAHTASEFIASRFTANGELKTLLEIE